MASRSDGQPPSTPKAGGKQKPRKAIPLKKATPLTAQPAAPNQAAPQAPVSRPIPLEEARKQGLLDELEKKRQQRQQQEQAEQDRQESAPRQKPADRQKGSVAGGNKILPTIRDPESPDEQSDEEPVVSSRLLSSWITSMLVHMILLLVLGLSVFAAPAVDSLIVTLSSQEETEEIEETEITIDPAELDVEAVEDVVETDSILDEIELEPEEIETADSGAALASLDQIDMMEVALGSGDLMSELPSNTGELVDGGTSAKGLSGPEGGQGSINASGSGSGTGTGAEGSGVGSELGGRAHRRERYSSPEIDKAVDKGIFWLARHQLADGGWSFEHRVGTCRFRCGSPGEFANARIAATGLALLPFLGAGHTPAHGEYRAKVAAGINFLMANMDGDGSLWEPNGQMYAHGIATLALCEAYGMLAQDDRPPQDFDTTLWVDPDLAAPPPLTEEQKQALEKMQEKQKRAFGAERRAERQAREKAEFMKRWGKVDPRQLKRAATKAAGFIVAAQAADGGWRYKPGEPGDMSVVGWQIMALKSAQDAKLVVSPQTIARAAGFLNATEYETAGDATYGFVGTRYAYQPNKDHRTSATTAIGLACRVYMGTSPFHPGMKVAVHRMAQRGHLGGDMYYNYYANQVMFQHGGEPWERWYKGLSQFLINSQAKQGHLEGSWHLGGDHGSSKGGRLYCTAMACLCLEETFRHLPMFRNARGLPQVERLGDVEDGEVDQVDDRVDAPKAGANPQQAEQKEERAVEAPDDERAGDAAQ